MEDSLPLGVALHYLIGLLTGLFFGAVVSPVNALHVDTTRKDVALGVLVA